MIRFALVLLTTRAPPTPVIVLVMIGKSPGGAASVPAQSAVLLAPPFPVIFRVTPVGISVVCVLLVSEYLKDPIVVLPSTTLLIVPKVDTTSLFVNTMLVPVLGEPFGDQFAAVDQL